MRKAGKQRIAAARKEYKAWRDRINPRIAALKTQGAAAELTSWADDVGQRIELGELDFSVTALAQSVNRNIQACEDGIFSKVVAGSWVYATKAE